MPQPHADRRSPRQAPPTALDREEEQATTGTLLLTLTLLAAILGFWALMYGVNR
jgi:hypothetical protein